MWDAIVVGGGPGGSVAAYRLAGLGRSVCLLEKEEYPRHKPCGGGLPPHVGTMMDELGMELEPYVESVADRVQFLYRSEDPVESDLSDAAVTMVNRADFDRGLARQAGEEGADVRTGRAVRRVENREDHAEVTLRGGDVLRGRFVVGADGAGTRVGRSVGLVSDRDTGVALDAEVQVDPEAFEAEANRATFNINFVDRGYGWTFPKRGYLALGVGGYDPGQPYNELIQQYIDTALPPDSVRSVELYGHPLPFYRGNGTVVRGRVGLVGDAAGMVDALSGEGIFYAMKSGRMIAESIDEALAEDAPDLSRYGKRVGRTVFRDLKRSSQFARVFFQFPRRCYEQGVKRPQIVNWIKKVVVSEASYGEIYDQLWAEIKRRAGSKLLRMAGLSG